MIFDKKITFVDFCAGIGAGRLGLEQNDLSCIGFSEINTKSIETYNRFFGNGETNFGDLTKINFKDLPDFDLMIAGFPCQSFSINGKRKGFNDERGQIIFSLINILVNKNIKYFIFENVKGLVNINNGIVLEEILRLLDNAGYDVVCKVLNTLDYGLPQSRERVYFVGIKKDLKTKKFEFPEGKKCNYDLKNFFVESDERYEVEINTFKKYLNNKYNFGKYKIDDLLKKQYLVIDTRQSDLRLYNGYIPTLRTGRAGICYIKNGILRKLSGKEALLFQGFPPEFYTKANNISDLKLLEQTGNAMSVNVISAIAKNLKEIL